MTFVELLARGGLPLGVTAIEAEAADRQARGEKLGPRARRSADRLVKKLEAARRDRQHENWDEHDRILRDGRATARSAARHQPTEPARPGGAGVAAPSRSTASVPAGHGGSVSALSRTMVNGRSLSAEEYHQRLAQLGLDGSFHQVDFATEQARKTAVAPSLGLTLKADQAARVAAERQAARVAQLEAGKIDARTEKDPGKVASRLLEILGPNADLAVVESFRPGGEPLKPPPSPVSPTRLADAEAAARRMRRRIQSGQKIDARTLSPEQHAALLRAHGFDAPLSWGPGAPAPPSRR